MRAILLLAIKDLFRKTGLMLIMALLFGTAYGCYFSISCFKGNLERTYGVLSQEWLVVQQSSGVGEIHGSRLSADLERQLIQMGYENPIPEIHQVVGTNYANGMLMRGVDLVDYPRVTPFTILSGNSLQPGDKSRLAIIGKTLADIEKVKVGDTIKVRGRDFLVEGIFKTGTYQDNEVWISLSDAQQLLNYGKDVSIYIIPDGGAIKEGTILADGISVGRKGETAKVYGHEFNSFYRFLGMVAAFAGIATIITLANLLWRLTRLNSREFGIIRTLGFGNRYVVLYLFVQATLVFLVGLAFGSFISYEVVIGIANHTSSFGLSVDSSWNWAVFFTSAVFYYAVLLLGIALPALRISRLAIPSLLGRD